MVHWKDGENKLKAWEKYIPLSRSLALREGSKNRNGTHQIPYFLKNGGKVGNKYDQIQTKHLHIKFELPIFWVFHLSIMFGSK